MILRFRQRTAAVVGAVEIVAHGITVPQVTAVTAGREIIPVGRSCIPHDDFRLVVLFVFPTALFSGYVIGIDIEFVQPTQITVFPERLIASDVGLWKFHFDGRDGMFERRFY